MSHALKAILQRLPVYLLVSCLTFLFAGAALAAEGRAQPLKGCTDFRNIGVVFINLSTPQVSCETFRFLDQDINSIQQLTDQPIHLGFLAINPRKSGPMHTDNYGSENVMLSKLMISYDELGIEWNQATKIIFAHEIGHLLLDSYMSKQIPLLRQLAEVRERNALFMKTLFKIQQLRQGDATCALENSVCARDTQKIIGTAPVDMRRPSGRTELEHFLNQHQGDLKRLAAIQDGYQELFADLVQALVFNHPAINSQASRLFGEETQACRTFNRDLPLDFTTRDPHCSLSAVRVQLWKEFVTPNLQNKKFVLSRLASVIQGEVSAQMYGSLSNRVLSPAEQGSRLLQILLHKN